MPKFNEMPVTRPGVRKLQPGEPMMPAAPKGKGMQHPPWLQRLLGKRLLGSGMADKAGKSIEDRKKKIDEMTK